MRRIVFIGMLGVAVMSVANDSIVGGKVYIGSQIMHTDMSEQIAWTYLTHDARLGSNSGNQYTSLTDHKEQQAEWIYGADLSVKIHPQHTIGLNLEGKHDRKHLNGTRTETITASNGTELSRVGGTIHRPKDQLNHFIAGATYTCSLPHPGEQLSIHYQYQWDDTRWDINQQINAHTGWDLYQTNLLYQHVKQQNHHAQLHYVRPIQPGHVIAVNAVYDRRQIDSYTQQQWDQYTMLDTHYLHLIQYGGVQASYRLRIGPVKALVALEYRANLIQQRWMHDVIPTAMLSYQIDSVHLLSAHYGMKVIRPDYSQLDTTKIRDAYSLSFGNDQLTGTHVHTTNLTYRMALPKVVFSTELRYITASDGLNALWIERNNIRTYTWGNEGIRHAVGLTPSVNSLLAPHTRLVVTASVLWDQRIAAAINMSNANWGITTKLKLEQSLPYAMAVSIDGDYTYHNTLDLYSYSGHGGKVGLHWRMALLPQHNLTIRAAYTCRFIPDIHITQGGWTGIVSYPSRYTHLVEIQAEYKF